MRITLRKPILRRLRPFAFLKATRFNRHMLMLWAVRIEFGRYKAL